MILCMDCIRCLSEDLNKISLRILLILAKTGKMTRSEIQKKYNYKYDKELSYAIFRERINELNNKLLINSKLYSKTKIYSISEEGVRLLETF